MPRLFLILGASLALASSTLAVDPLPPHIENASEEVRLAYIERTSRESGERKIEVGIRRHKERMLYKSQLANNQRVEATERLARRRSFAAAGPAIEKRERGRRFGTAGSIATAVILLGLGIAWVRHHRSKVA